ncbi:hypothetical protein [Actinomadura latina]|uniref:Uncharacterized protein n=1 Tax=Actinomadura latina TaxID=163603 RepID=A0A846ZDE0_9ACTN|nr:hypothetical protein [Actinomadura latina]NKZ08784.1 hypothetical protein [Actinomadura latina]
MRIFRSRPSAPPADHSGIEARYLRMDTGRAAMITLCRFETDRRPIAVK